MKKTVLIAACLSFLCFILTAPSPVCAAEDDILINDFEAADYGDWKVEGEALGKAPAKGKLGGQMHVSGFEGKGLVNTFLGGDGPTGKLTSPEFTIERDYIKFLIGGGAHKGKTCMNLLIDGEVALSATGSNNEFLNWENWDVQPYKGKTAVLQIVDEATGGWGHVNVDQISQTNTKSKKTSVPVKGPVAQEVYELYEAREFQGMPYRLMKPIDYDPSKTYPLILSLHGGGGRGTDNVQNLRDWNGFMADESLRRKHPCFVVAPQTSVSWRSPKLNPPAPTEEEIAQLPAPWQAYIARRAQRHPTDDGSRGDLPKVYALLDELGEEFKIDEDRLYVLGHSMGGFGSWRAIWEKPQLFAAAIPTAGGLPPWYDYRRFADVPVWAFHGSDDRAVPVFLTREIFTAMKAHGGNMKYTELPNVGHGAQAPAFTYKGDDPQRGFVTQCASDKCDKTSDIWDWLFSKKR